jgi:hypothetical protein
MAHGSRISRAAVRNVPAVILLLGFTLATVGTSAHAATFGELGEAWGKAGTGSGQFFKPGTFGVDPQTGDVYAGDMNSSGSVYRIQKFTKTGELKAAVEFSRKEEVTGKLIRLVGIAVDPVRERFYVLEACRVGEGSSNCSLAVGNFVAYRLKAFKTTPNAGKLELASTFTLPLGEKELYNPTSIAVDPASGDVVILGEDNGTVVPVPEEEEKTEVVHHTVLERVSPAGVVGTRFTDESNLLRQPGLLAGSAMSLAVGRDGTIYTLTGGKSPGTPGAKSTRAWELPAAMTELKAVPGFAAAAEAEKWPLPEENGNGTGFYAGPGIAISPDGSTLYWKEAFDGTETVPGGALVRAYSLAEDRTRALYGGGTSGCSIRTPGAGIGATGEGGGEELLVFDYGPEQASPPYGAKVLRFGEGGTGCPASLARFSVDGREEDGVEVGRGDVVNFDATSSELANQALPSELIWTFGDGQEQVVKCEEEETGECLKPAAMTTSHEYAAAGEFTVRLEIKLEEATFGNPQPVQRTLIVKGPAAALSVFKAGTGSGTVTSSPAGINCGETCSAEFEAGKVVTLTPAAAAGSEFTGWSGACAGTGACHVTMSEAESVTASFTLEEGTPPPSEFQLTVFTTGLGSGTVSSSPSGVACGSTCAAKFQTGALVTLTPAAAAGSEFTGWSGVCVGTGACAVTMSEARSVSASFEPEAPPPPARYKLTIVKAGSGLGTVASSRAGIYCGGKCEKEYEDEENVALIPTAESGSTFSGWSGGGCAGTGICRLTMDAAKSVTATFEAVLPPAVDLTGALVPLPGPAAQPAPKAKKKKATEKKCGKSRGKKRARCTRKAGGKRANQGKARHHGRGS